MTADALDPAFRLYHEDPQRRALETLQDMQDEARAELADRQRRYPPRVAKGLMAREAMAHELAVFEAIVTDFEFRGRPTNVSWVDRVAALRREILRRRELWPRAVAEGKVSAELAGHRLELLESLHDFYWSHDVNDEAVAARQAARDAARGRTLFD